MISNNISHGRIEHSFLDFNSVSVDFKVTDQPLITYYESVRYLRNNRSIIGHLHEDFKMASISVTRKILYSIFINLEP